MFLLFHFFMLCADVHSAFWDCCVFLTRHDLYLRKWSLSSAFSLMSRAASYDICVTASPVSFWCIMEQNEIRQDAIHKDQSIIKTHPKSQHFCMNHWPETFVCKGHFITKPSRNDLYCLWPIMAPPVPRRPVQLCGTISYRPNNSTGQFTDKWSQMLSEQGKM